MNKYEKWVEDYKKYIKFQCECLLKATQYGGSRFSKYQFPTFKEFQEVLGNDNYDYTSIFYATEYDYNFKPVHFSNVKNYPFRPDLFWAKVSYSNFMGCKWNFKFEYNDKFKENRTYFEQKMKNG